MKYCTYLLLLSMLLLQSCGDGDTYALIETEYGNMKVKLYNSTPLHRDNFIKLAKEGYYDDLLFHRVINGFMVQGGDPNSRDAPANAQLGGGGPNYKLDAEIGAPHFKGRLAAARQGAGNPEKKSSGSQFYIVHGSTHTKVTLDRMASQKRIKYNDEQIKLYQELGGRPDLDGDYTVFGEVVEGLEVIDKIAAVPTGDADRPMTDIKMKVKIL